MKHPPREMPGSWTRITTIDAHAAGEPLRVVTGGWPEPVGSTILEKRRHARGHADHLRRALMLEPRGHADMYGCLPTAPVTPDGDLGVLFLHNEGYSTMCGHGIVGLVTVGLEAGLWEGGTETIRIDTPAGRVTAMADRIPDGRVRSVSFDNVASFALELDREVEVPDLGPVRVDLGFGGAFYAYVDAGAIGLHLAPENFARIVRAGRRIKLAVERECELVHPTGQADLNFLYGTIFTAPSPSGYESRNVCVFADGEVDRSPTGTGVSGRAAILHARGVLAPGDPITIESLVGTTFDVTVTAETREGDLPPSSPGSPAPPGSPVATSS